MKTKDSDTLKRINLLIENGKKFDFAGRYDHSAVLKWIGAASKALSDFPNEQRDFVLYCITYYGTPAERVGYALSILRKVRDRMKRRASW
jgi:hypothetical protein